MPYTVGKLPCYKICIDITPPWKYPENNGLTKNNIKAVN